MSNSAEDNRPHLGLFFKDLWGALSGLTMILGSGAPLLELVPVVPDYKRSTLIWTIAFTVLVILLFHRLLQRAQRHLNCAWSSLALLGTLILAALYAFLFDFLPSTDFPTVLPTFSELLLSVTYAATIASLTAAFATLRCCGPAADS